MRASGLPASARLIMLTLADVAEVGTAEIPQQFTPSLRVLADETGLNESTVKRHLLALEADGWIVRDRPTAEGARLRGERTGYRLLIPEEQEEPTGAQEAPTPRAQEEPSQGAEEAQPGRTVRPSKDRSSSDPSQITSLPRKRGTRIPDDFHVTPAMVAWARENVPAVDGRSETAKFVDYWTARPGREALKLDWAATWRVWMRSAADRVAARASPKAPPSNAPGWIPPEERCEEHPDQRATNCRHCNLRREQARRTA